jgi:hypothetical protein
MVGEDLEWAYYPWLRIWVGYTEEWEIGNAYRTRTWEMWPNFRET